MGCNCGKTSKRERQQTAAPDQAPTSGKVLATPTSAPPATPAPSNGGNQ